MNRHSLTTQLCWSNHGSVRCVCWIFNDLMDYQDNNACPHECWFDSGFVTASGTSSVGLPQSGNSTHPGDNSFPGAQICIPHSIIAYANIYQSYCSRMVSSFMSSFSLSSIPLHTRRHVWSLSCRTSLSIFTAFFCHWLFLKNPSILSTLH